MSSAPTVADDTRTCPFCGESIKKVAIKCRHCGELLGDPDAPGVFRQGKRVVLSRAASLPPRCVKSNEPAEQWLTRNLSWHPPLVFLTILLSPLIYIIAAIMTRKTATVRVPLTAARFRRRRRFILIAWLLFLGGIAAMIGGGVMSDDRASSVPPILIIGGLVAILVAPFMGLAVANPVAPTKMDEKYIWLRGVHPAIVGELPEWTGEM
jgi:hypothetical protein